MGVHNFETMFDMIDLTRKGSVSLEQVHTFCETLYFAPVCIQHVDGAINLICHAPNMVTKREFLDVLTDVERRRTVDEQAYWDFQVCDVVLRQVFVYFTDCIINFIWIDTKQTHGISLKS